MSNLRKTLAMVSATALIAVAASATVASAGASGSTTVITVTSGDLNFLLADKYTVHFTVSDSDGTSAPITGYLFERRYDESSPDYSSPLPQFEYNEVGDGSEHSQRFNLAPGWSACYLLYSPDGSANQTPCFGSPVDDAKLKRSDGWKRAVKSGNYMNTISTSAVKGSTLKLEDAWASYVGIVATKCPGCGSIKITMDGAEIDTIDLSSGQVKRKQRFVYDVRDEGSPINATFGVKVTTNDKPVNIDGLGVINTQVLI